MSFFSHLKVLSLIMHDLLGFDPLVWVGYVPLRLLFRNRMYIATTKIYKFWDKNRMMVIRLECLSVNTMRKVTTHFLPYLTQLCKNRLIHGNKENLCLSDENHFVLKTRDVVFNSNIILLFFLFCEHTLTSLV